MGDDQTKSESLGAPADGREDERLEDLLVAQSVEIKKERVQVSEEVGKVVRKHEYLALKPSSACEENEGPGEPHSVTLQTAADGISHADQGGKLFFQAEVGLDPETTQVAARHFVRLPMMVQHQRGATTRSTDQGGKYLFHAEGGVNPKKLLKTEEMEKNYHGRRRRTCEHDR